MTNSISDNSNEQEGSKSIDTEDQIVEACTLAIRVNKSLKEWPMEAVVAFKAVVGWNDYSKPIFVPQMTQMAPLDPNWAKPMATHNLPARDAGRLDTIWGAVSVLNNQ